MSSASKKPLKTLMQGLLPLYVKALLPITVCMRGLLCIELSESVRQQYIDNIDWIKHAHQHNLVSITTSAVSRSYCYTALAL